MSSIMGEFLQRFDFFVSRFQQIRTMQQEPNKVVHLQYLENNPEKRAIPLFGSDPEDPFGFGYDAPKHSKGGPIPRATIHNTEGIHEDATPLFPPQKSEI